MRYLIAFAPMILLCLPKQLASLKTLFNTNPSIQYTNPAIIDQEKPTAVCLPARYLSLMEVTGTITILADELEAGLSSDNYSQRQSLKFSFSTNPNDKYRTFDCNDLGKQMISLWVTDEAGNQDYCQSAVYIVDKHHTCGITRQSSSLASLY